MNLEKIIVGIVSLLLLMIGIDKFLGFLEPPCTLMEDIPSGIWMAIGVVQVLAAILIWQPKFRRTIAGVFVALMIFFIVKHLMSNTTDIGGAAFMGILCALLLWSPGFLRGAK